MATLFQSFSYRLSTLNDEQLVHAFNQEVGVHSWTNARGAYLAAIHREFDRRGLDYSLIGDERRLSFQHPVRITGDRRLALVA